MKKLAIAAALAMATPELALGVKNESQVEPDLFGYKPLKLPIRIGNNRKQTSFAKQKHKAKIARKSRQYNRRLAKGKKV